MPSVLPALNIFIGYDSREPIASSIAEHSIKRRTSTATPLKVHHLKHRDLRRNGFFSRPWMIEPSAGGYVDLIDGKPFSTEFSHTRFLIPELMNFRGWALFMDADMLFQSDITKLFALIDNRYAVMCVKHHHQPSANAVKMDNRVQLQYYRKNWSSFVLWNCTHPANQGLTKERVNYMSGGQLHAFSWLKDEQIGALPATYNYISGISPDCREPSVIHYTEGGPWFPECTDVPLAQAWLDEYAHWQENDNSAVSNVRSGK